jgi:ribosome-interacting GTPase 1
MPVYRSNKIARKNGKEQNDFFKTGEFLRIYLKEPPRQPKRLPPLLRKEGSSKHEPSRHADLGFGIADFGLERSLDTRLKI